MPLLTYAGLGPKSPKHQPEQKTTKLMADSKPKPSPSSATTIRLYQQRASVRRQANYSSGSSSTGRTPRHASASRAMTRSQDESSKSRSSSSASILSRSHEERSLPVRKPVSGHSSKSSLMSRPPWNASPAPKPKTISQAYPHMSTSNGMVFVGVCTEGFGKPKAESLPSSPRRYVARYQHQQPASVAAKVANFCSLLNENIDPLEAKLLQKLHIFFLLLPPYLLLRNSKVKSQTAQWPPVLGRRCNKILYDQNSYTT